jgi:hypothetical protein
MRRREGIKNSEMSWIPAAIGLRIYRATRQ